MDKKPIDLMVDRFLGWKLPVDFSPDCGISFKREYNENTAHPMMHEPTGTNLFNAIQAKAMIEYILEVGFLNKGLGNGWQAYYAKCKALGHALDRIVELEAKHPEWMKRIQRERKEEQQRCIEKLLELVPMCDMELTREYLREELAKDA